MRTILISMFSFLMACGCGATQRPDGGEGLLAEGAAAPDLTAPDHMGSEVALRDQKTSLVFFYPKDGTPGCTKEACAFRDVWAKFDAAGIRVIGVSTDDAESHRAFAKEHELPFSLVADEDRKWAEAFGVGKMLGMSERVSFLIGPDGKIRKVYPEVDPGVHASDVLADAGRLGLSDPP